MCEDDVVARAVLVAATGRGRAGETEFEDHVGGYVGVVGLRYSYAIQLAMAISKSPSDSYNLRQPEVCRERDSGLGSGSCDRVSTRDFGEVREGALETPLELEDT